MSKKTLGIALVVIIAITIGGYRYPKSQKVTRLGANPGPTFLVPLEFEAGVTYGNVNSTSTAASMTMRVSDVQGYDTVVVNPTGAAADKTLTFFASSTATSWLPRVGDRQETCFVNATTTAATTITFAAGTGIDLETSSSTITDLTVSADNTACFQFIRSTSTSSTFDIKALMTEYNNAD